MTGGEGHTRLGRVAFLASGSGSNFEAVTEACQRGEIPAEVVLLIMSREGLPVAERARRLHVDATVIDEKLIGAGACDSAMLDSLEKRQVDLIVLAGFLRKVGPRTLDAFQGRIVNTHPAPLPRFGGKGMYGDHVHRAVLEAGASISAATVHMVEAEYDAGPVIAARPVAVLATDTVETLRERVRDVERRLLVQTIGELVRGRGFG